MSSTAATNDSEIARQTLKIIIFFLSAVVIAGLLLILLGGFLTAM